MLGTVVDFVVGVLIGGLSLSAGWGLFWFAIGIIGFARRACSWRVVLNSAAAAGIPLLLVWGLMWARGPGQGVEPSFAAGLSIMPLVLMWLGLRPALDGQRAGAHMLKGVRHLMDELLGKHHECGGCGHESRDHGGCG